MELAAAVVLGGENIVADEDYLYVYNEALGGYEVTPLNKTKYSYNPIRTGINGYRTVSIANSAFYQNSNITIAPVIPYDIKIIGEGAFEGCINLTKIAFPESVTSIGMMAFAFCEKLITLQLPTFLETLCPRAFMGCTGLIEIVIPDRVRFIESEAFKDCTSLESFYMHFTLQGIDDRVLAGCTSLTSIYFRGNMEEWNAVVKHPLWNSGAPATYVELVDGSQIPLNQD
jgi:hypothetical protein